MNDKLESEFGKGFIYNLILFSNHFSNDQAEKISNYNFVMKKSEIEREKILSNNPPSNYNYGWNKDVKWWYDKIVPIYGTTKEALSSSITCWANGATDHLYELEIPEQWENDAIGTKVKWLKDFGLDMGHGFKNGRLYTFEDYLKLQDITKQIALLVDEKLGLKPIKAQYQ